MHCHQDIFAGDFQAPAAVLQRWRHNIRHLTEVPNLDHAAALLQPEWVARYLQSPHDVHPGLEASMPRLAITSMQARDIAAYLSERGQAAPHPRGGEDSARQPELPSAFTTDQLERGRALFRTKACGACHAFEQPATWQRTGAQAPADARLAPDLRYVRERVYPERLVAWLLDPKRLQPSARMPNHSLDGAEAQALAHYLQHAPLPPLAAARVPERLPPLERHVTFSEVERRVLRKVCWHCHSEPDLARGDGGPGMTGGFGFSGRQLDLSTYSSVLAGYLDDSGQPTSVFRRTADGTPMLVAVLLARQREQAGLNSPLRGMPLGLPAMSPEDIQLVESWIEQGRPE